jgi:hypothetical protein
MPLNQEGIAQLKADLRANAQHYNQNSFGKITPDCGTECCMAGLCFMRKVSVSKFNVIVKELAVDDHDGVLYEQFVSACVHAGGVQLGLTMNAEYWAPTNDYLPPIFNNWTDWPRDLAAAYAAAEYDPAATAEVACMALDRIDEYGCFKEAV